MPPIRTVLLLVAFALLLPQVTRAQTHYQPYSIADDPAFQSLLRRLDAQDAEIRRLRAVQHPAYGQGPAYGQSPAYGQPPAYGQHPAYLQNAAVPVGSRYADFGAYIPQVEENSALIADLEKAMKNKASAGHKEATMKVVGRVHADAWGFPENDSDIDLLEGGPGGPQSRLLFRRLRFGVRGDLPGNMQYRIEMEFAGGEDSEFRDAWIGWNDLPYVQTLLIGNQKRPYGLDHLNSSRYNVFLERPFVIEGFNQDARRLGVASYNVSDNERWTWRYGIYNQRLVQDEGDYLSDNWQPELAGRLANTFWWDECSDGRGYGHWAISGTAAFPGGPDSDNDPTGPDKSEAQFRTRPEARSSTRWLDTGIIDGVNNYTLLGAEGVLNFGPLQIVGEYQHVWVNRVTGVGDDLGFYGGYIYASYFLTGEHMPWNRERGVLGRVKPFENYFAVRTCDGAVERGIGAWQIAARYSYADFHDADVLGGVGESFTFGLNWYWTPYARMQFNYIHGEIENNGVTQDPLVLSGNYDILGARFMVDF
ncbi:MAG: porin [Planctomycetota bacterium]|nr:MAG: porin [Planctomycetota bacterium]